MLIENGLKEIYKNLEPVKKEFISIEFALNRVIAQNIFAQYPLPNYDNSAMDGYGVTLLDAGEKVKIIKTIFAGDKISDDFQIKKGEAVKIMTGGKIPKGCLSIIPFEDIVENNNSEIQLPNFIKVNNHIRKMGEDIAKDKLLIEKGERLNSYKIGLLASQGISFIEVYKKPKVAIFATGAELKMYYETIESHQIYNTNSPMLLQRVKELGCDVTFIKSTQDTKESIKDSITECLDSDLIITSGGVSKGEADFTKESFLDLGFKKIFEGIKIKPGKPVTFGKIGKTAILNLAGNPSAALINFEIFGKSAIFSLSGDMKKYLKYLRIPIQNDFQIKKGKYTVILGNYNGEYFIPLKKQSAGMVKPLVESNGFIITDSNIERIEKGSLVKFFPTNYILTDVTFNNLYSYYIHNIHNS